ncbi:MAG: 1,4-alpha-glucan-branching enzyme, partial [Bacteroidales bacterium]|nr:1,4-alpha-glucan-branching enzyme [Bacteroidales bacterium]
MMEKTMIYQTDPYLEPFKEVIDRRHERIIALRDRFAVRGSLSHGINNHLYYGMHREADGSWVFREWAPNANRMYLIGEFNNWKRTPAYEL